MRGARPWWLLATAAIAAAVGMALLQSRAQAQEVGTLTIDKQTVPRGADQSFALGSDVCFGGGFALISDDGNSLECRFAGTATVFEDSGGAGFFELTDVVCDDGTEFDPEISGVTITLDPAEEVHCTFINTDQRVTLPEIRVTKVADPAVVDEPGEQVAYSVTVGNIGDVAVTLDSLSDDVVGSLDGVGSCAVPQAIPVDATYSCLFSAHVSGDAGDAVTNTLTAEASDDRGNSTSAHASATVTITDALPTITLDKSASPSRVPETGRNVVFSVLVTNQSPEPVELTVLQDDLYGDVSDPSNPALVGTTCALPRTLQVGGSHSCTFTVFVAGNPWEDPIDTVTGVASDNEGNEASASDSAQVDITQVAQRSIQIDGLDFTLSGARSEVSGTFLITNASDEPIDVLVTQLRAKIEYRTRRAWTVSSATCAFEPAAPTVFSDQLNVAFVCSLDAPVPSTANTLRVTAIVNIDGRNRAFTFSTSKPI